MPLNGRKVLSPQAQTIRPVVFPIGGRRSYMAQGQLPVIEGHIEGRCPEFVACSWTSQETWQRELCFMQEHPASFPVILIVDCESQSLRPT